MIYKYTKCESVIAKIMADANMSDKNLRVTDIREWIFEAVEKIGAPVQYMQRESGVDGCPVFEICDRQIPMPEDLESLTAVAYSVDGKHWKPARKDDSTFHYGGHVHNHPKYHHFPEQPAGRKIPTTLAEVVSETGTLRFSDKDIPELHSEEPRYFVKPGWIVMNKPSGFVKLAYKSIATDERGYPLIPDLASYQEAIYWYVMMKLSFPKFLTGSLGGRSKYNFNTYAYLQQQWNFYRNQAYAEAMMPNESEMMTIKNEWTKLIPDWESDMSFFSSNGEREIIYDDYAKR